MRREHGTRAAPTFSNSNNHSNSSRTTGGYSAATAWEDDPSITGASVSASARAGVSDAAAAAAAAAAASSTAAASATAQRAASIAVAAVSELAEYKRTHGAKVKALLRANDELKQELVRAAVEAKDNVRVRTIKALRVQVAEQKTLLAALKEKLLDLGMSRQELAQFGERVLEFPLLPQVNVDRLEAELEQLKGANRKLKQELRVARNDPAAAVAAGIAAAAQTDPRSDPVRFNRVFYCQRIHFKILSKSFYPSIAVVLYQLRSSQSSIVFLDFSCLLCFIFPCIAHCTRITHSRVVRPRSWS